MHNLNNFTLIREQNISDQALAKQFLHHLLFCTPLLLTVPLLYLLAFNALGQGNLAVWPFCLGVLGWTIALLLRAPMVVLTFRLTHNVKEQVVAAMAGPAEEVVRLVAVLLLQANFASAISLGLGWATIEVLYTLVAGFSSIMILSRGGVGALQLKKRFLDTGLTVPATVYSGVIERLSATALHIGFTLLLAYHPLFILITLPLHSLVNVGAITLNNRSALATQTLIALFGITTLLVGLKLFI
jgi:hypothetical protein